MLSVRFLPVYTLIIKDLYVIIIKKYVKKYKNMYTILVGWFGV